MKISWIKKGASDRLVIFFGGFACDENLLSGLDFGDFDVAMLYDYSSLDFDPPRELFGYFETHTVAWSFGVWAADYFMDRLPASKTRTALCGSPFPVDDARGIPSAVFSATLENFSEEGREKFLARVFGPANMKECAGLAPRRDAARCREELASLAAAFPAFSASPDNWTRAIAAKGDRIFPLKNMRAAWGGALETVSGEHFPAALLAGGIWKLFRNSPDVGRSFEKSFGEYGKAARVQRRIASRLAALTAKRISAPDVKNVLEIGVGTGFLTSELAPRLRGAKWHLNDLSRRSLDYARTFIEGPAPDFIEGDAQIQDLPSGMDLIVSASCFQWFESLDGFFEKLAASCAPGAVMAFSTFLPDNFRELRSLCGKGLNYVGIVGVESLLNRAGFELLCAEAETIKLDFDTPEDVLRHLRSTGVKGTFAEFWTPAKLRNFSRQYREFFPGEKGVTLTYRPAYFISKFVGARGAEGAAE